MGNFGATPPIYICHYILATPLIEENQSAAAGCHSTATKMQKLLVQVVIVALVRHAVSQSCSLDTDGDAVNTEVLILGAGISGIAAARTLEVNGVDFLVIEATDRIGGRIREYNGTSIEVGANWIQGLDRNDKKRHPIWREWLECDPDGPEGSETPDDFERVYNEEGNEYDIEDYKEYERISDRFDLAYSKAVKLGEGIEISNDISLEKALEMEGWDPNSPTPLDEFVEWLGVDLCSAIHPRSISVFHHSRISYKTDFLADKNDDAIGYLIADKNGYSFVVDCLARNFKDDRIQLNSKITKIETADDCVCVTVEGNDLYCGNYSIVTFSIGALQASIRGDGSSVQFEPSLPKWKQDALNNITPVHYGKIHLQFDTQFWDEILNDEDDQQILGYVSNERGYYPYFIFDKNRPYTISTDVTEGLAEKISDQFEEQTVNEVMAVLRKIFGEDIPEPRNAIISHWSIDPLFLCTFSVLPPGAPDNIYDELLKPVGRLYFAGEALNETNTGFTQGGYGSGVYVAKNVIKESKYKPQYNSIFGENVYV